MADIIVILIIGHVNIVVLKVKLTQHLQHSCHGGDLYVHHMAEKVSDLEHFISV